jgi:hypothetical protein
MFKIINFIFTIIVEIRQLSTIYLLIVGLIILVIYYIISMYKSKISCIIELVTKYIKQIITLGKSIDKKKICLFISVIINIIKIIINNFNHYIPIINIIKRVINLLMPMINIIKKVMIIIQPYVISLMHVISNKLEKYKLARIIKKDVKRNDKINKNDVNINISTSDIQLLIKLVTDKTINRNVYEKLIRKYNKKRVEKYNIYNNRIHDKNMRKDLDFLETLIKKKLDIDDARLFIVILLYYVKNSPNFQL